MSIIDKIKETIGEQIGGNTSANHVEQNISATPVTQQSSKGEIYDSKLEQLIDAALADGELTEKEKQVLFKRAEAMGIDLDEFEMVLDARLYKISQQKQTAQQPASTSAPQSEKYGDVKKCPACGAMIQSYQGVCPECGYAFENIEANSSARRFSEQIDQIIKEGRNNSFTKNITQTLSGVGTAVKINNAIKNFPIPNTKADLMEFIILMRSKMNDSDQRFIDAYSIKYDECVQKARVLFPNDKDFASILENKNNLWKKIPPSYRPLIVVVLISFLTLIILSLCLGGL